MKDNNINFGERRQYPRFRSNYVTTVNLNGEIISTSTIDISEGGIGITMPHKILPEDILNLIVKYNPDDIKKHKIKIEAKVIWCKHAGEGIYRTGLRTNRNL